MPGQQQKPDIFNGEPLRIEVVFNSPLRVQHHGETVSADDIILLTHIESRLRRSMWRLKKLAEKTF